MKLPKLWRTELTIERDGEIVRIQSKVRGSWFWTIAFSVAIAAIYSWFRGRFDPTMFILGISGAFFRNRRTLVLTPTGFDFSGGAAYTRDEFRSVAPASHGRLRFSFSGGNTFTHFERLSEAQGSEVIQAIEGWLSAKGVTPA